MLTVSSAQKPKSSQAQITITKRLCTHNQNPTGQASQLYGNLTTTGEPFKK